MSTASTRPRGRWSGPPGGGQSSCTGRRVRWPPARVGYNPRPMDADALDHVALWVADRDPLADFLCEHAGMHVIDRTDAFTLVGSDARRGKLTLFAAEGPREPGPLERVVLRVSDLDRALAALPAELRVDRGADGVAALRGARGPRSRARRGARHARSSTTSTTWCCACPTRRAPGRLAALGLRARWRRRLAVGDKQVRARAQGRRREGERPLLNHIALLVDSGQEQLDEARGARDRDRGGPRRGEHLRVLRLGAGRHPARVRRAQARVLAHLIDRAGPDRRRRRHGGPRRRRGGRPRWAPGSRCCEKGDRAGGSMLLSSGVVWRHRDFERFRAECPGGDPALQRTVFERLDADLAWLESLGARAARARDRQPAHRPACGSTRAQLTEALVAAAGGTVRLRRAARRRPGGRAGGARDRRLPGRPRAGAPARDAGGGRADAARRPVEHGRRAAHRPRGGRDAVRRAGRVLRAQHAGAAGARGARSEFVRARAAVRDARHGAQRARRASTTPRTWSEIDVVQWTARQPGARAWYEVARRGPRASGCATARWAR